MVGDLGAVVEQDPDVLQARRIADVARGRLVACMAGSQDVIDLAEAQRMLDAFRNAVSYAEEAEDRVLVHRGLLSHDEAGRRSARRRPVTVRAVRAVRPAQGAVDERRARRVRAGQVIAGALTLAATAVVGAALGRRLGLRPPLTRW